MNLQCKHAMPPLLNSLGLMKYCTSGFEGTCFLTSTPVNWILVLSLKSRRRILRCCESGHQANFCRVHIRMQEGPCKCSESLQNVSDSFTDIRLCLQPLCANARKHSTIVLGSQRVGGSLHSHGMVLELVGLRAAARLAARPEAQAWGFAHASAKSLHRQGMHPTHVT